MKTKVREISHKGSISVVEWVDEADNLHRVRLPSSEIIKEAGELYVENPEEGVVYGVNWEDLIRTQVGPKEIANLLRKRGIWTYEDYLTNTPAVTSVFNEACSLNRQQFREAVLARMQGVKEENNGRTD